MNDIDAVSANEAPNAPHIGPHDKGILGIQRQGFMGDLVTGEGPRHGATGRCHYRGPARLLQGDGDVDGRPLHAAPFQPWHDL